MKFFGTAGSRSRLDAASIHPSFTMNRALALLLGVLPAMGSRSRSQQPCPGDCLCYESSGLVDCHSRELTRVPHGLPHGTWLLDLSGNRLTHVQGSSFKGLWTLKILLIYNNSIQNLQSQSLSSLEFLERLDLSYNRLKVLPPDFSNKLTLLQELRLDHNLLRLLHPTSLHDLENLRKLDLSHNQIMSLDVRTFYTLSRLVYLNLEGNKLNILEDALLGRQQNLQILHLAHNNISVIKPEAFTPLRSVTLLSLHGNQLHHIRFKTFLQLQAANTHLQLSSNPWTCDCELQRVFGKIQHVRHLHVVDYKDIICSAPPHQAGLTLAALDSQLCMAETVSVLVITVTVVMALIGTLMKAERNRKKMKNVSEVDEDKQEK